MKFERYLQNIKEPLKEKKMIVKTKDLERSKASLTRASNDMHVLQLFQEDGVEPVGDKLVKKVYRLIDQPFTYESLKRLNLLIEEYIDAVEKEGFEETIEYEFNVKEK